MVLPQGKVKEISSPQTWLAERSARTKNDKTGTDTCFKNMNFSKQHTIHTAYNQNYKQLYVYATSIIEDKQCAEDIVYEAFLKLMEEQDRLKADKEIKKFLFIAVQAKCRNHLREKKKKTDKEIEEFDYLCSQSSKAEIEKEILNVIAEEITKLPPQRRKILKQLFWEGRTSQEVAERMKLSRQTVLNQKVRALKTLHIPLLKKISDLVMDPFPIHK